MKRILMLAMVALPVVLAKAELKTWTGSAGDGVYQTAGNWDPVGVPAASDDILIKSGNVTYDASLGSGDWTRANGSTFTMTGGSFTQTEGIAYMQISGAIRIEGGAFSMGTAGQLVLQSTGSIAVSAGSFTAKTIDNKGGKIRVTGGDFIVDGNFTASDENAIDLVPTVTMTINGELKFGAGQTTLGLGNYVCNLVSGETGVLNLDGSCVYSKGGYTCGVYGNTHLNFVTANGNAGSYTFNGTSANDVYTTLFESGLFTLDGSVVSQGDFEEKFEVSFGDGTVTIAPVIEDVAWRVAIDAVSAITDTSAKVSATVKKVDGETGKLYYALSTSKAAVESATLADMTLVAEDVSAGSTAVAELTGLVDGTVYYVRFVLADGGEIVAVTQTAAFTASNYDNIYADGAWSAGMPVAGQRILFKDAVSLSTAYNLLSPKSMAVDVGIGNKVVFEQYVGINVQEDLTLLSGGVELGLDRTLTYNRLVMLGGAYAMSGNMDETLAGKLDIRGGAFSLSGEIQTAATFNGGVVTAKLLANSGTVTASATRLVMTDAGQPFGTWHNENGTVCANLVPGAIANGVIPAACGYQFHSSEAKTDAEVFSGLFEGNEPRVVFNGEAVTQSVFDETFMLIKEESETMNSYLATTYALLGANDSGKAYDAQDGAVIRLAGKTVLSALAVNGPNAIIDLNGNRLSVTGKNAFVLNGNVVGRGDYTAAQLNEIAGANIFRGTGNVSVGKVGFALFVR